MNGLSGLSEREREIVRLYSNGLKLVQVAHELGMSVHGVKKGAGRVVYKLGARNLTHACAMLARDVTVAA